MKILPLAILPFVLLGCQSSKESAPEAVRVDTASSPSTALRWGGSDAASQPRSSEPQAPSYSPSSVMKESVMGKATGAGADRLGRDEPASPQAGNAIADTPKPGAGLVSGAAMDTVRGKFLRTADIRFRARSVIQTTYAIESAVARHGGYVEHTQLGSRGVGQRVDRLGDDRAIRSILVEVENSMVLRIPSHELDTTLKEIAPLVAFLDQRTLDAHDAVRDLERSRLEAHRHQVSATRLQAIGDRSATHPRQATEIEENALQHQTQADEALLKRSDLDDRIRLSVVRMSIYQDPYLQLDTIRVLETPAATAEPLMPRVRGALRWGWNEVCDFGVGLLYLWPLLLAIAGLGWLVLRWRREKSKEDR